MSALGIPTQFAASFEAQEFGVWPENWPAFELFVCMGTQWRIGMNGATGLDYSALPVLFDTLAIQDRQAAFRDLRIMESEALKTMREQSGQ